MTFVIMMLLNSGDSNRCRWAPMVLCSSFIRRDWPSLGYTGKNLAIPRLGKILEFWPFPTSIPNIVLVEQFQVWENRETQTYPILGFPISQS